MDVLEGETEMWEHLVELEFAQKLSKADHEGSAILRNSLMEKYGLNAQDAQQCKIIDELLGHMDILKSTDEALELTKYAHKDYIYREAKQQMEILYEGQKLSEKQFEILIHAALEMKVVKDKIAKSNDKNLLALLQEFKSTTHGEAVGFLILHELFKEQAPDEEKKEFHGAFTVFIDHQEELQKQCELYQREHKDKLRDLHYEKNMGGVGLIRNYVEEYLAKSKNKEDVSWLEIEKYVSQDTDLSDRIRGSILGNIKDIILLTGQTPTSYIEAKGNFVRIETKIIIAHQEAIEKEAASKEWVDYLK